MYFIVFKSDDQVRMRVSTREKYDDLKDTLEDSQILVDNGEYKDNEWPVNDDDKEAIIKTFRKQIKGKGLEL